MFSGLSKTRDFTDRTLRESYVFLLTSSWFIILVRHLGQDQVKSVSDVGYDVVYQLQRKEHRKHIFEAKSKVLFLPTLDLQTLTCMC